MNDLREGRILVDLVEDCSVCGKARTHCVDGVCVDCRH